MAASPDRARVPIAGVAVAGVVAGHALTYLVAVRQPAHREAILVQSGHSYWSSAVAVAIVLGFVALAAFTIRIVRGPREAVEPRLMRVAATLGLVQVLSYMAIEVVERALSNVSIAGLFDHHEILRTGILLQIGVAALGALFLRLLARTLCLVAEALRTRRLYSKPIPAPRPGTTPSLRSRALRCAWGLRGPPSIPVSMIAG